MLTNLTPPLPCMIGLILNETVANLQKVFYAEIEIDFVLIEYVISLDNYPTMCAP